MVYFDYVLEVYVAFMVDCISFREVTEFALVCKVPKYYFNGIQLLSIFFCKQIDTEPDEACSDCTDV